MRCLILIGLMTLSGCANVAHHESAASTTTTAARNFGGWAAINGGGAHARASNDDWHVQNDLQLRVGGGRVALHWRDGASSGYSLELAQVDYPERKLQVLQLSVVEDATGKPLTYVWADNKTAAIGLNLGWLQVGLQVAAPPPTSGK